MQIPKRCYKSGTHEEFYTQFNFAIFSPKSLIFSKKKYKKRIEGLVHGTTLYPQCLKIVQNKSLKVVFKYFPENG